MLHGMSEPLSSRLQCRRAASARRGHRLLLALSGEPNWCRQCAAELLAMHADDASLWLGGQPPLEMPSATWGQARQWLGRELDRLVVDTFDGLDVEGLAALSGTLRAGGLLLMLTPPLESWGGYPDPQHQRLASWPHTAEAVSGRLLQRLGAQLKQHALHWQQGGAMPKWPEQECEHELGQPPITPPPPYAHAEQQAAVAAIHHVVRGHRRRPLVLTADRGRGKSAALGIATAQLLQQGLHEILLTAPRPEAVAAVFRHAEALLPGAVRQRHSLHWQGKRLRFFAPDALLSERPDGELLLVDEAAALPLAMLEAMVRGYARLVLASTVHGYEGSGRGFVLRFAKRLDNLAPGWQACRMTQAVRWAEADPLEAWCNRVLLLDAEAVADERVAGVTLDACQGQWLRQAELAADEATLQRLFGLLQLAHYRTSPNDLRQLLDSPDLAIHVLRWQGEIVAAMVLQQEGGLDPELAEAVATGERRVQGHLLPQSLAAHVGFAEAATLRAVRVVRIVVHPACQARGLGQALLRAIPARFPNSDWLGASFGASVELLGFWQRAGYAPLRLGLKREISSGAHAVMVVRPLSAPAHALFARMRERFCHHLSILLREPLNGLEAQLALTLLQDCGGPAEALELQDWRDLRAFAQGRRGYEVCIPPLQALLAWWFAHGGHADLDEASRQLLIHKVVQQQPWQHCIAQQGLEGRKQAETLLREAVGKILSCCETNQD